MTNKTSRSTFRSRMDTMVTAIRGQIHSGQRSIGEYLPSELTLAQQFQLSKTSVRKGLDLLVEDGIIEKVPRVGTRVVKAGPASIVTLKFGYYPTLTRAAQLQVLIKQFQALHPHIRIEMIPIPYEDDQPSVKQYMEKDIIDVASVNYHHYQHFGEADRSIDLLEPLENISGLYPFVQQPFVVNGASRVLPLIFSPVVLCYNKDHFREADLPEPDSSWSWSDVEAVSLKLASGRDRSGFFYHLMSDNRWPIFLLQGGYEAGSGQGFKSEAVRRGLQISRDLIYRQGTFPLLSERDSDAEMLFAQQKVSMIMTTYFSLNALRRADFDFDVAPLPTFHDAKTLLLIIGIAVHSHSPNKEAAMELVRFLLSYESQLYIREHTLSIPALKKAAEWQGKEAVAHLSRFHMYRETFPTFRLYTELNVTAEELQRMRQVLKLYWSQIDDLDTVCRRLEEIPARGEKQAERGSP
ncbi:hypothetical protein PAESOLCIP111_01996 [Paenibacillus solanacearum]|uniref:HTH gntR-type domain-containing protein n=1 Tax=Paenibacillus solanacearum TaxID=2048548 RepID=A0A916JZF0_9BACL|nr:extracellular solute-binding protein [Paenibacillus solanacearum]CAG7617222.1 hypothetical protein PAESOLCIP111_01996 [Paenibacillus solanacearum]